MTAGFLLFAAYLSSAAADVGKFSKYKKPTTSSSFNQTIILPSVIQCAGHCELNNECSVFTYDETAQDCVMMNSCENPEQLQEATDGNEIYADTASNHLLARGIGTSLLLLSYLDLFSTYIFRHVNDIKRFSDKNLSFFQIVACQN